MFSDLVQFFAIAAFGIFLLGAFLWTDYDHR